MSAKMEELLATQSNIIGAMDQLLTNFKKDSADRKTQQYIKKKLSSLEAYWQEFQSNHIKLCECSDKTHEYFVGDAYQRTSGFYIETRAYIQKYLTPETKSEEKSLLRPPTPLATGGQASSRPGTPEARQQPPSSGFLAPRSSSGQGTSSKLDEMLRKQLSNFKAFSRTIKAISVDDITSRWELEDALRSVQSRWSVVDSLHWEINSELYEENFEYEQSYGRYEQQFNQIKKSLNEKMWSQCHRERSTPQMDIPTFNGNYQQWTSFKDLFVEAIHNNQSLSNAQKMQFLKSKLKGESEKLVQHLPISAENYDISWEILTHRYNNQKLIFNSYMNTLTGLPTLQQQSAAAIKKVYDTTNECLNAIKALGVDTSTWDPIIVYLITNKLDADTHTDYNESLKNPRDLPTLKDLLEFLELKFTSLEASKRKGDSKPQQQEQSTSKKTPFFKSFTSNKKNDQNSNNKNSFNEVPKCAVCNSNKSHGIFSCETFLEMDPHMRQKTVEKLSLCKRCLKSHRNKKCFSSKKCRECEGEHNTLLHNASSGQVTSLIVQPSEAKISQQSQQTGSAHVLQGEAGEILLATALVNVTKADGTYQTLRALIDQGSQTSLISENAAQILGIKRQRCKGIIFGVGAKEMICKGTMGISISSRHSDYELDIEVFIMKHVVNNLPNQTFTQPSWPHLENIQLADPEFFRSRSVDLLLGADVYSEVIMSGIIRENPSMPIAQQTRFGWILCGSANVTKSFHCNVVQTDDSDLSRFWSIEDVVDQDNMSTEDLQCLQLFKETTERQADGRYVVRLPLHSDADEKLGRSKTKALAQFYQVEQKVNKDPNVANAYKTFMTEYLELGHMYVAASTGDKIPTYYLPHHCVRRSDSSTTALRVVFNASGVTSSGYSLNDVMYRGPNLQKDLLFLVLKWRQYKYAYTADIEKMFRQIWVHEDHHRYQTVVYRNSTNELIKDYSLATVSYGTKAAPFLAMMTLKQLASDERRQYPAAAKVLEDQFYMDDLLSGSHSKESAQKLKTELIALLKAGGFHLRKWASNEESLQEKDNKDTVSQETFDFRHQESTKALGLTWKAAEDIFTFTCKMSPKSSSTPTKRNLLSEISKVFDPLGWLSPVVIQLKILFQDVWTSELQWDDKVPEDIYKQWIKIREDIDNIEQVRVPRWIGSGECDTIELHGFCDASSKAFAAVVYARIQKQDGTTITLLAGKTKVNPIKSKISLPRLELSGAQLLANLMTKLRESLTGHKLKLYGWCDSTAVLGWLGGEPSKWKPFVANRVIKIKEVMPLKCWRYVKSNENPADCASRGLSATQLQNHKLWWNGPTWLSSIKNDEEKIILYNTDLEKKVKQSVNITQINSASTNIVQQLLCKHSNFARVARVLAWIMRLITKQTCRSKQLYLSTDEIRAAQYKIIKCVQSTEFAEDIMSLKNNKSVNQKSRLLNMNPFLDKDGMLRVGGRLRHSNISEEMKHPLIIPHCSHFTDMLIDHAHKHTFHGGARLTLSWLRQEYWIVGGNRAVKKRLQQCVICKRHNPVLQHQIMGDLPSSRTESPSRPFYRTGCDFTGFIDVKSSKGRGIKSTKGYVSVFVCMVTKAIHLELVSDLSSSAYLAALRRFSARRGTPCHIYCDNGTNFVGANKVLSKEFVELKSIFTDEFQNEVNEMKIEFHFLAPSWPSAGGLWESGVKSLKHHLRRVVGEQKLTFEEFTTLLTQLEACLNSRPLCALSEDTDDINYLTPSHFLASGPVLTIYETEQDQRTRWHLTQKIFQDIWKRWRAEYLTQLLARSKWREARPNIKLDDIVIIHDANLPAGRWVLGRVIELHPGKDNHVRVVSIKTKSGILKRPVVKVSILPVNNGGVQEAPSVSEEKDQVGPPEPTQKRKKKSSIMTSCINIMTMIFFLTMLCVTTTVHGAYNVTSVQSNNNIYFDKVSDMRIVQDKWKLIVYYNMEPYWKGLQLLSAYNKHLGELCSQFTERKSHCDIIILQLRHGFAELEYNNNVLQYGDKRSRSKRGLIDGVGNIANSLFGVLDSRFAQQYEADISKLRENQKHLAILWKNQTSVIEAENSLLKRIETSMEKQHERFIHHINELEESELKLNDAIFKIETVEEFTMSSIIANSIYISLKNIQDALLDTITNSHEFNVHLLTPRQLREELSIISGQLSKDLSLPSNNIQNDLTKVYKILRVRACMTSQYFIFEIQIPLVNRDNYELFKTYSVPRQMGDAMLSITAKAAYFAINLQKDTYLPISENELYQKCTNFEENLRLCDLQKPVYQKANGDNLCVKDHKKDQCKTTISTCQSTYTELINVNTFMLTCCGQCTVRFICGYQVKQEQLSGASIIALGNDCVIKGETFTITSHKQHSSKMNIEPEIYPIEIAPVNAIINLTIPISHIEESSSDFKESIERIDQRIAEMKAATDHLDQGDEISSHDVHQYVAIYAVAAAAAIAGAVAWCRSRRAAAAASPAGISAERATLVTCAPPALSGGAQPVPPARAVPPKLGVSVSDECSVVCDDSVNVRKPSVKKQYSVKCEKATTPMFSKIRFLSDSD